MFFWKGLREDGDQNKDNKVNLMVLGRFRPCVSTAIGVKWFTEKLTPCLKPVVGLVSLHRSLYPGEPVETPGEKRPEGELTLDTSRKDPQIHHFPDSLRKTYLLLFFWRSFDQNVRNDLEGQDAEAL